MADGVDDWLRAAEPTQLQMLTLRNRCGGSDRFVRSAGRTLVRA